MVSTPGFQVEICESLRYHQKEDWPGRFINALRCEGLSLVPLGLKDILELFVK